MTNDKRSRIARTRVGVLLAVATATLVVAACQSTPAQQSPRPEAEPQAVPAMPPPSAGIAETLYFEPGSSTLSADQLATLRTLAGRLGSDPALRVHVVGYSDSSGEETANPWLSEQRAKNVASYLTSQGLPVGDVTLRSAGESEDPSGNPRRAVITLR